jgi:hypothetical protein
MDPVLMGFVGQDPDRQIGLHDLEKKFMFRRTVSPIRRARGLFKFLSDKKFVHFLDVEVLYYLVNEYS